eukprot:7440141-Pyramimonas_sp.AAC.1
MSCVATGALAAREVRPREGRAKCEAGLARATCQSPRQRTGGSNAGAPVRPKFKRGKSRSRTRKPNA